MPVRVTLSSNVPIKFEVVPLGTTSSDPNIVVLASNIIPNDFGMNFHTYTYNGGILVRNTGVTVDNRILSNPVFSHNRASVVATNTPAI